jgi:hypothetical protein
MDCPIDTAEGALPDHLMEHVLIENGVLLNLDNILKGYIFFGVVLVLVA